MSGLPASALKPPRPNVLFIAIDDMNDWIGPLGGYPGVITPHLDRLAARGMTFANAHTASSACHSSRVAIMTGTRPAITGIDRNVFNAKPGPSWRKHPLLKDAVTLSQHFRNHGYRAVGGGKIYHSLQWWPGSENDPDTWDDYFPEAHAPIPHQVRAPKELVAPDHFWGSRPLGNGGLFGWAPVAESDEEMSDYQVVEWASGELKKKHPAPFFIAAGIFRPHIPWEVPKKYFDLYPLEKIRALPHRADDLADSWDHGRRSWHQWVLQNEQWPAAIQGYLASITWADAMVGSLLDALDASAYKDSTFIVLWSDHGMHIGEKENWEKFTVWEESTRVPLFIAGPGIAGGTRCERPVSLIDVYPTLCELTHTARPGKQLHGESLRHLLRDPKAKREQPAVTSYAGHHSVRSDHWRYCWNGGKALEELYDHRSDADEFINLAYDPKHQQVLAEHRAMLERWTPLNAPDSDTPPAPYERDDQYRVVRKDFVFMKDAVELARKAHAAGEPVPIMGKLRKKQTTRKLFKLKAGEHLSGDRAPAIVKRTLSVHAVVEPGDGVIVAQGGDWHGYALYISGGKPGFAIRHDKKLFAISGEQSLEGRSTLEARLSAKGAMQLLVNGEPVASEQAPGSITTQPNDGLDVGIDDLTHVGEYGEHEGFQGRISSLEVRLGK